MFSATLILREPSVLPEPARQPQNHPNQAERRDGRVDVAQPAGGVQFVERAAHEIEVHAHPLLDLFARRRRQGADFVLEVGDGAVPAGRDARVAR